MWYATHWLMSIQFKDGKHESYPVLERVVLVEAWDHEKAREKATAMAQQEATSAIRWAGGRPADLVFLGVRKVTCLSTVDGGANVSLADGEELTCWEYDVREKDDLKRLAAGEQVMVKYIE